ncbi:MAG: MotA/TolQ/ExbB proton channel family protein [Verrucomicrobiae bacterium]|nr:MotA/TolQ/ExbB proton channel family protein [Verrucomicrobiae bacterium]
MEKPPLARETAAVASELRDKQRRAELARQERDALIHDLTALSNRVRIWRDERTYIDSLLTEFRKNHESQLPLGEAIAQQELFLAADGEGDAGIEARLAIAESAILRLADAGGPSTREGEALGPDGVSVAGRFVSAGPVSWFISRDGSVAGLVASSRDLQPEVVAGTADPDDIQSLADGKPAAPRFDPTLGTAVALGDADDSLIEQIRQGGLWIYPILALALIATLAAISKWLQLSRIRELNPSVVRTVLGAVNAGDRKKATAAVESVRHPARALLLRGIETSDRSQDAVEEALYEKYLEAQPPLQRGLPLIAIASATAPLLGLLGTVTGMIHTFKLINLFGTGDAKSLASGISEALITTEFGLAVAIPALILHALLSRKVQGIRSTLELTSLAFVNGLKESRTVKPTS